MATTHDIVIDRGATFLLDMALQASDGSPVNLTGTSLWMEVRRLPGAPQVNLRASTSPDPGEGSITYDGPAGLISIQISHALTLALPDNFTGVYDILVEYPGINPGEEVYERILQGRVNVSPRVTVIPSP
jgi:hypothetical protein